MKLGGYLQNDLFLEYKMILCNSQQILLGLLRIPRYTPVPWIEDNAILALPVSVLTYAVLYTLR
jgi:hypothetical protein